MSSDKWNGVPLVLVVVENCLDRHAEEDGERVALIWEKDRPGEHEAVTYRNVWVVVVGVPVHIIASVCVSVYVCGVLLCLSTLE